MISRAPLSLSPWFTNDDPPYASKYAELIEKFSPSSGHSEAKLVEMVATLPAAVPIYFLVLSQGECLVVHGIRRFPSNFLDPTEWDYNLFGTVGDIVPNGPLQTVSIPDDFLAFANDGALLHVPTIDNLVVQEPGVVEPIVLPENETNTHTAVLRKWVPLPPKYAALLLQRGPLSPKEVWNSLVGAIHADDAQDALRSVVDWVTLACISPAVLQSPPLEHPVADSALLQHRMAVLVALYPIWYQQSEDTAGLPSIEDSEQHVITPAEDVVCTNVAVDPTGEHLDKSEDQSSHTASSEVPVTKSNMVNFIVPFTTANVEVSRNTLIYGAVAGAAIPLCGAAALTAAGFGTAGVLAGSWAASVQTAATASGSWFATCQSLGATGALFSGATVAGSAATGTAVGALYGTKVTEEEADPTKKMIKATAPERKSRHMYRELHV
eukprot:Nitzschia sp. Nitz4//scaffold509_size6176//508//1821//NITZ4_009183-RA/size6176-processed-gene-0.1-mRNA-1//1//CDS//3329553634//5417//frame0